MSPAVLSSTISRPSLHRPQTVATRPRQPIGERCHAVHGNGFKGARRLESVERFDPVLAGGVLDYLPDRHAIHLLGCVVHGLLAPGGTFFFTNLADGNPHRAMMEHIVDWFVLERSPGAVRDLCAQAGVPAGWITIDRDATGLALLVEVTRPGHRGSQAITGPARGGR